MKIVIFCGGYGTRMWPASRKSFPKQFYPIVKGKSFFQQTYSRFRKGFSSEDIFVSTEQKYAHFVHEQAPKIPKENIIVEPERRDLLGAIGLIAAVIEKRFPREVMFFSWSDHFIANEEKFIEVVKAAGEYTKKTGVPVSTDAKPTFASVHNGWLEQGDIVAHQNGHKLYQTVRHVEKPDERTAKKYLMAGNYLIHTGYGAWRSDKMLSYYEKYRPNEYNGLIKIMESMGKPSYEKVLKDEYSKFEKISVEYGLFEKLPKGLRLNIPMLVEWEDAGTWQLFYDAMLEKGEVNVIEGDIETEFIDSFKNLVVGSKKKLIAIVGLKNIAVIDTDDALLICDLDETQKVKDVFKKLEAKKSKFVD